MALQIRDLHVAIGDRVLLRSASFQVPAHQLTVIVGASGSGKSTLLRIIAGLQKEQQDRNGVQWSGEIQWTESEADRRVGLVFQQPALLDELSAEANIQLAMDHGRKGISQSLKDSAKSWPKTAREWLDHLHIPTSTRISKLSGGQRQRLSLAQTLASQPSLIIFDEPTTGLDASHAHRVAELIRQTQTELGVTAIVVTHDYESFLEIADQVLLLDASQTDIVPCRNTTRESMRELLESQIVATRSSVDPGLPATKSVEKGIANGNSRWLKWFSWTMQDIGGALEWSLARTLDLLPRWPSLPWGFRFFAHYARLVTGLTAILYLAVAGGIIGFVATFFTLKYMPYKIYTEPLLLEELLGAIGFAIYRILIPVMTTILVAARCGAAVSADLGNKRYGNQVESLEMLHVPVDRYLWTNVVWSFLIGTVFLNQVSFAVAQSASLAVHLNMQPELGAHFWSHHFFAPLRHGESWFLQGFGWNLIKLTLSAFGTALITYRLAMQPKHSSSDVSRTITTTILWSTLWTLLIHMVVAFYEFGSS